MIKFINAAALALCMASSTGPKIVTVEPGDTLTSIAKENKSTVYRILTANKNFLEGQFTHLCPEKNPVPGKWCSEPKDTIVPGNQLSIPAPKTR